LDVVLVNAASVRSLPGRKTDVSDAAWLADLGAHGLVKASFAPPAPIRALRDLTRTRTAITRERTREVQRLEKLLGDAGIKLSSVAIWITGVCGRAMREALIAGQRDSAALAEWACQEPRRGHLQTLSPAKPLRYSPPAGCLSRMYRSDLRQLDLALRTGAFAHQHPNYQPAGRKIRASSGLAEG
jgi:transposase